MHFCLSCARYKCAVLPVNEVCVWGEVSEGFVYNVQPHYFSSDSEMYMYTYMYTYMYIHVHVRKYYDSNQHRLQTIDRPTMTLHH